MRAWTSLAAVVCASSASTGAEAPGADPYRPIPYVKIAHPEWTRSAVLYQINTRQFTQEGTLRAAEAQLPRLKPWGYQVFTN